MLIVIIVNIFSPLRNMSLLLYVTHILHLLHTFTIHVDHFPSDLLVVWSGNFSAISTNANRRDCMDVVIFGNMQDKG